MYIFQNKNNHKQILHKSVIFCRDTIKVNTNCVTLKKRSTNVVSSISFLNWISYWLKVNFVQHQFKCKEATLKYNNEYTLKWLVESKYNKDTKKYVKLIEIILNINFLEKCYLNIKLNSVFLSNSRKLKWFQDICNQIKNESYLPQKVWRVYSIKKEKSISVLSLKDKIIQEGLWNILLLIYGSTFSKYFYGLKRKKTIHNTIKQVKSWKDTFWSINLNIEKHFDETNKKKLINILKQKIDDSMFLNIIKQFLKIKSINLTIKTNSSIENVFRNNTLPSMLVNVYLNELDWFVENLMFKFNKVEKKVIRRKYYEIFNNFQKEKNKVKHKKSKISQITSKQKTGNSDLKIKNFKRVKYVWYLNDFLINVLGDKIFAFQIMNKLKF